MPLEVAPGMYALLHHEEGVGVNFLDLLLQSLDLVFGQADAEDLHLIAGVGAVAGPVGDAPVHLPPQLPEGLQVPELGDDEHLGGDVLLVHPVHKQGVEHRVNGGIDGRGGAEQDQAQGIQGGVEQQGELAHREALALFGQIQPQNVQPAAGGAAGQHQAVGKARQDAAHQAAGEHIRDDGLRRNGDDGQKQGVGHRAQSQLHHEGPAHGLVGQQQ